MKCFLIILIIGVVSVYSDSTEIESKLNQLKEDVKEFLSMDMEDFKSAAAEKLLLGPFIFDLYEYIWFRRNDLERMFSFGESFIRFFDNLQVNQEGLKNINFNELSTKLDDLEELASISKLLIECGLEWIADRKKLIKEDHQSQVKLSDIKGLLTQSRDDLNEMLRLSSEAKQEILKVTSTQDRQVDQYMELNKIASDLYTLFKNKVYYHGADGASYLMLIFDGRIDEFKNSLNLANLRIQSSNLM